MKSREEIKKQARFNFTGQYWICVAAFALYVACTTVFSGTSMGLAVLMLSPPVIVAYAYFSLRVYLGETGNIGEAIDVGFKGYLKNLGGILWMYLFIILWTLLFIIPGIIKAIAYSMTPYILAEMKNVTATEAIKISMKMTAGHKCKIFVMILSFIGWWILTALTWGILAFFYTGPYFATTFAGFYEEIKQNALDKGLINAKEVGI